MDVSIEFRSSNLVVVDELTVTQIAPKLFRLEATPFSEEATFGDIIEADQQADGSLVFLRVASPSPFVSNWHLVPKKVVGSAAFQAFIQAVEEIGGSVEVMFGGCVITHLPQDSTLDPEQMLQAIWEALR